jgi:hypothetical protein
LARLISVIASLAFGFLIVEIGVRTLMPSATWKVHAAPGLGWASDEYLAFDPEGDSAGSETSKVQKILFLGDSYLAGSGVEERADRFPTVMQEQFGNGIDTQIIASGGWGTDQELLAFIDKGRRWKPDLVVLAFTAHNDLRNNLSNQGLSGVPKPYFVADPGTNELALFDHEGKPAEWKAETSDAGAPLRSHLWDLLVQRIERGGEPAATGTQSVSAVDPRYLLAKREIEIGRQIKKMIRELSGSPQKSMNNFSAFLEGDFDTPGYAWKLLEAILMRLDAEVSAVGAELVVLVLPDTLKARDPRFIAGSSLRFEYSTPDGPITLDMKEPGERLRAIAERHGIALFDPTAAFIQRLADEDLLSEVWPTFDNHFSEVGHTILAGQLLEYLQHENYLK